MMISVPKCFAAPFFFWVFFLCSSAHAEWLLVRDGHSFDYLNAVSSPNGDLVTAVSYEFLSPTSNDFITHAYTSADRGKSFAELPNSLQTMLPAGSFPRDIFFVDEDRGWVLASDRMLRTDDAGQSWESHELPVSANTMHVFDTDRAVVGADGGSLAWTSDGGQNWTAQSTPASCDLRSFFWLDDQRGWVAGHNQRSYSEEGNLKTVMEEGAVLRTINGGDSWELVSTVDNRGLGSLFFLDDGQRGWLATQEAGDNGFHIAHMLKTTDGGENFQDANLPNQVGTMQIYFSDEPIHTTRLVGMYWSDAQHGHLVGTALIYTASARDKAWRTIDYMTSDGGTHWRKTSIGALDYNPLTDPLPETDGVILDAHFHDLYRGWTVGEFGQIWRHREACSPGDCAPGYLCSGNGYCISEDSATHCLPACGPGEECVLGVCEEGQSSDDGGPLAGDSDEPIAQGDTDMGGDAPDKWSQFDEDSGCSCGAGAGLPSSWLLVCLMFLWFRTIRAKS